MTLIFDIETDGLLDKTTKIHSLVIYDTEKDELISCKQIKNAICETYHSLGSTEVGKTEEQEHIFYSIEYGLNLLQEAEEISGHNIVKFDIPAIQNGKWL